MKSSPSKTVPVQSTSLTVPVSTPTPELDTEGEELKSKENFQLHLEVFCFYNYFVNKKNKKKEG